MEILEKISEAVTTYQIDDAAYYTKQALEQQIDPLTVLDTLNRTIRDVGKKFETGELFIPELIMAAEAVMTSTRLLEEEIIKQGKKKHSLGNIVIGTVFGDIHDIGKNMVTTLLRAAGFNVIDCGINVKADVFIEAVEKNEADMLALSALLTTTAQEQRKVIQMLSERGMRERVKVIVGGGGISAQFADSIGADGYDATASGAVALAKRLLDIREDHAHG